MHYSSFVSTVSLVILGLAAITRAAAPTTTTGSTVNTASTDLQSDLRDFQALIPRRRIGYIAARHYIVDARFRSALAFVRSPEFASTWQQIRNTSDFVELLSFMRRDGDGAASGFDVTTIIDRIPNQLHAFNIPTKVPVSMMFQRTVSDFVSDVVRELPRARFGSLMARKVQAGGEFSQLYQTVRSEEFMELLQKTRKSPNLAAPIRKLNQNFIDVDNLIKIGLNVLSWGP
ncbi:uncharacterized protein LOC105218048 [Zeugodacus cucurbitae]|uniref:uncharacterized protein LOC105218048 n=1 Tax=Zeugodacus cucurbitae TaxID=28588 RepID=UPI0023D96DDC|nr:uncharacterized protein LOC105218048 [Zeugodacus cucurbitae]